MQAFRSAEKYLKAMAEDNPESVYGQAAAIAAYRLGVLTDPVSEPLVYVRATKTESR